MSQFYFNPSPQPTVNAHMAAFSSHPSHNTHHGSRARRGPRSFTASAQQTTHKPVKPTRVAKETAEVAHAASFRRDFEAARSFDLEDDELFCPWHLLTEDDVRQSATPCHSTYTDYRRAASVHAFLLFRSFLVICWFSRNFPPPAPASTDPDLFLVCLDKQLPAGQSHPHEDSPAHGPADSQRHSHCRP